jgi:hypothetical protein
MDCSLQVNDTKFARRWLSSANVGLLQYTAHVLGIDDQSSLCRLSNCRAVGLPSRVSGWRSGAGGKPGHQPGGESFNMPLILRFEVEREEEDLRK